MKILIVDDIEDNLFLLETVLTGSGYEVESALNGAIALEKLKDDNFDLIISDILMPVMDGFQLCREVKADNILNKIPFIFYTATYTNAEDEEFSIKLGVDKFIRKPIEPAELIKIIQELLKDLKNDKVKLNKPILKDEEETFKLYSERLINKLEKKMVDLEKEVTERKLVEEVLRESNKLLMNLTAQVPGAIYQFLLRPDGTSCFPFSSKGMIDVFGVTPEQVKHNADPVFAAIHPDDLERIHGTIQRSANDMSLWNPQCRLIHPDKKEPIWAEGRAKPERLEDGSTIWHGFITDITERKQAEETLQASEEKFRTLYTSTSDAIFLIQDETFISCNPKTLEMYGCKEEEIIGHTPYGFSPKFQPDGRLSSEKAMEKINATMKGEPQSFEWVHIKKDGTLFDAEVTLTKMILPDGDFIHAVVRDISERKQAEEEIRKLSTAVQQSPSVIAITDIKGNLEYVNPKFTELTGYTSEEAIGINPRILKSGDQPDKMYKELWKTISSGKEWRGEFHNKKKDGECFWEAASISPIFDKNRNITNYIKVAKDVTERKQSEQVQLVLYNIAEAVNTTKNLNELYKIIHQQLGSIIDTTNFYIANYNEETDEIYSLYFIKKNVHNNKPHKFRNNGVSNYIIKNAKPLFLTEELRKELIKKGEIADYVWTSKTLIGVPLKIEKKIVGCMVVRSKKEESKFTKKDLSILELISYQIALAIERKQAEEQIARDLKIKTALIQEIYHRTKNNMAVISAMLSMQSRRSENEYVKSIFREIRNKIQAMSLVHQKLYKAKDLSNINLKDYIEDLANLIMQSYGALSKNIELKFDLQDVKILIDSAVPMGLIINELVSNIFKHAFPNRQEGEIFIRLFKEEDETINLELCDNGIGFPQNFDPRKDGSMGLVSVFSIAEYQLKGEISVKSENGLRWHLKLKDNLNKERV